MKWDPEKYKLLELCGLKGKIDTNPDYQRLPAWNKKQKQFLMDTILRGYDIPKMYWNIRNNDKKFAFEVVDGQQRLLTIWDFHDNDFALDEYMQPINGFKCAGKKYGELDPNIQKIFNKYKVDVIIIKEAVKTNEEDEIGDMFLRLQNGTTLKAQERRNAMAGDMRNEVKRLAKHPFFKNCGFKNSRYTFDQMVAQVTCIELAGGPTNIRKKQLDAMYEKHKFFKTETTKSVKKVEKTLDYLCQAFSKETPELISHSVITLYCLASILIESYVYEGIQSNLRDCFIKFEADRKKIDGTSKEKNIEFIEYKKLTGNTTDAAISIAKRLEFLEKRFFEENPDILPKDKQRRFSDKQRLAIYRRDEEKCQLKFDCDGKKKLDWNNWHADHIEPYSKGGQTIVANGQVACPECNLAKSNKALV